MKNNIICKNKFRKVLLLINKINNSKIIKKFQYISCKFICEIFFENIAYFL